MKNENDVVVDDDFADTLEEQARAVRATRVEHALSAGMYRAAHQRMKEAEHALNQSIAKLYGPPSAAAIPLASLPPVVVAAAEPVEVEREDDEASQPARAMRVGGAS